MKDCPECEPACTYGRATHGPSQMILVQMPCFKMDGAVAVLESGMTKANHFAMFHVPDIVLLMFSFICIFYTRMCVRLSMYVWHVKSYI